MEPLRPSSADPNAPYRAAIAALEGHPIAVEGVNQPQLAPAQYQQNTHEGLVPRRNVNRDRLNQIAHYLGSGVKIALEMMNPEQVFPANIAQPSNPPTPSTQVTANSQITTRDIQQYLRAMGYGNSHIADQTIRIRLDSANISAETYLSALQILQDGNHPLLASLGMRDKVRNMVIAKLVGIVNSLQGFRPEIRSAVLGANNSPDQLIANLLTYTQRYNLTKISF